MKLFLQIFSSVALLSLVACSSARMSDHESDQLFRRGKYTEAAERLQKGLKHQGEGGRDSLLYLLDIGLSLHAAGQYAESNQAFLKADQIAEIKDYTSLSAEAATLLTSDNIKDYKGEDFEKVLISTYLAMNYALMGDVENALVEARRVNHKLHLMVSEGKRKYKQSAFARYLSALLYEAEGNMNDAYIDYQSVFKLRPNMPGLGRDLWRCARALRMHDEMERWDHTLKLTEEDHQIVRQFAQVGGSEIIVLYENGISPIKKPHPNFYQIPKFYPRYNSVREAEVQLNGQSRGTTVVLEDIESIAIENLDEKYGGIIAKKIAGIVAKESVGYAIAKQTNSPLIGFLTKIAFYVSDQADLRSWNLLPRDLQILRLPVAPGTYRVSLSPLGSGTTFDKVVQVNAHRKVFVNFRFMP